MIYAPLFIGLMLAVGIDIKFAAGQEGRGWIPDRQVKSGSCEGMLVPLGPKGATEHQIAFINADRPKNLLPGEFEAMMEGRGEFQSCQFNSSTKLGKEILATCIPDSAYNGCRIEGTFRNWRVPQGREGGGAALLFVSSISKVTLIPVYCAETYTNHRGVIGCSKHKKR